MVAIGVALLICTCSADGAKTPNRLPPVLTRAGAEQLMLRADDTKRLAASGTADLADAFRGRALQVLEAQAQSLDRRGMRVEERNTVRTLAFWDHRALEAVLQVVAQRRLVTPDDPNPDWAATVRQWWARLQFADGSWWVVDQQDLTPDRWRAV
jgi:hypothetical protein